MDRKELMLAALAAGEGVAHTPGQVQKMFFLLDRKVPERVGGPHFHFTPGAFGPFDAAVSDELHALESAGLVEIQRERRSWWETYRTTPAGQRRGEAVLAALDPSLADFMRRLSSWVRGLSFAELVGQVNYEYPDMSVNTVFRDRT